MNCKKFIGSTFNSWLVGLLQEVKNFIQFDVFLNKSKKLSYLIETCMHASMITMTSFSDAIDAGYFFKSGIRTCRINGALILSGRGKCLVPHFWTSKSAPCVTNLEQ